MTSFADNELTVAISDQEPTRVATANEETVVAAYTKKYERGVRARFIAFTVTMSAVVAAAAVSHEDRARAFAKVSSVATAPIDRLAASTALPGPMCSGALAYDAVPGGRVSVELERVDLDNAVTAAVQIARVAQPSRERTAVSPPADDEMNDAVDVLKRAQGEASLE